MAVHPEARLVGKGYRCVLDYRLPADGVGRPTKGNRKEAERLLGGVRNAEGWAFLAD